MKTTTKWLQGAILSLTAWSMIGVLFLSTPMTASAILIPLPGETHVLYGHVDAYRQLDCKGNATRKVFSQRVEVGEHFDWAEAEDDLLDEGYVSYQRIYGGYPCTNI